jgi:outer membrane protein assembly factor BamB
MRFWHEVPTGVEYADALRLYVCDHQRVDAYDGRDLKQLWRHGADQPPERINVPREIYARARDPKQLWTGAIDPPPLILTPDGLLIVETYHSGDPNRVESILTCLRAENGAVRWRFDGHTQSTPQDMRLGGMRICGDPAWSDGQVFTVVASRDEFPEYWLCALASADGRLLWRLRCGGCASRSGPRPRAAWAAGHCTRGNPVPSLAFAAKSSTTRRIWAR